MITFKIFLIYKSKDAIVPHINMTLIYWYDYPPLIDAVPDKQQLK